MGVIDLNARVTELEKYSGEQIDDLEAAVTALENLNSYSHVPMDEELPEGIASMTEHYPGCYYEIVGRLVHVAVNVEGLTATLATELFTLPEEIRATYTTWGCGVGGASGKFSTISTGNSGKVMITSEDTKAHADLFYVLVPDDQPTT